MSDMKELEILFNARGQRIGSIIMGGGQVFIYKTGLDRSKHQLLRPPAWALDKKHVDSLHMTGRSHTPRLIRLVDTTDTIWEIDLQTFYDKAFEVGRGHGIQLAVVLKEWTQHRVGAETQGALI